MFFNGGIIITFNSFPSECRNSQVFAHSDFKMTLSFAIIGSTAATTLKLAKAIPECKNGGISSLNVKKLLIFHLVWKTNRILQYGSLFFIMQLILARIWRENLPKYGTAITKFFLGTVLTTGLDASILSERSLMHFSTKPRG